MLAAERASMRPKAAKAARMLHVNPPGLAAPKTTSILDRGIRSTAGDYRDLSGHTGWTSLTRQEDARARR